MSVLKISRLFTTSDLLLQFILFESKLEKIDLFVNVS